MRDYFFPVTVVFVLLCNGCFAFGTNSDYHPFDAEVLASIQPGTTKTADVAELFGAPTRVVKLSNGNAYVYQRSVAKAIDLYSVPTAHRRGEILPSCNGVNRSTP